jgi:glycosyltransferase involved in cell wall biosynthesis
MSTELTNDLVWSEPASARVSLPLPPTVAAQVPATRQVLHIINGEHYSGAERVQDLLAARLPEFGYEVSFACLKPGRFLDCRNYTQSPAHVFRMRSRFDFRAIGQLGQLVDQQPFQLLHAHTPRSLMVGSLIAARRGLPLVYHVHSPASRDSTRPLINRINTLTERLGLAGVARIVAVSHSLAEHMRGQGFASDRIVVVPNGVPCVSQRTQRSLGKPPWTLGTVALFRPRKGTEVLLRAVSLLRARGLDVRLSAVGGFDSVPYEQQLQHLTDELGLRDYVRWTGFQRDVNRHLREFDVFVLPSLFGEGMPMVVLEAMAMGIPVVGTHVEGVPEVIRDGLDGRIAEANDPAALARAIASILEGEFCWESMSGNALARHAAHFSDHSMARALAALYDAIIPAGSQPLVKPTTACVAPSAAR